MSSNRILIRQGSSPPKQTVLQGSIYWKIPPPPGGREISADVIWGKKYEKAKRKRWKMKNRKEGERK
jgi:hypothetical protein